MELISLISPIFRNSETSGIRRSRTRKSQEYPSVAVRSCASPEHSGEKIDDDAPVLVNKQSLLRDLRRIQRSAEADRAHSSALKSVELVAKFGLPAGGKTAIGGGPTTGLPGPAEVLLGPDYARSGRG